MTCREIEDLIVHYLLGLQLFQNIINIDQHLTKFLKISGSI